MKGFVFWDIMLCSLMKVNRHFGGTCCCHLQGQRVGQARNHHEPGIKQNNLLAKKWIYIENE
jgi:hypothetical protein